MGAFKSVGSLVRRVALWSLCAGFICEAQAQTRTWTGGGEDRHSVWGDPLFVDAANHDYRLRPDSPALKLGFRPIDLSKVGPREGALVR